MCDSESDRTQIRVLARVNAAAATRSQASGTLEPGRPPERDPAVSCDSARLSTFSATPLLAHEVRSSSVTSPALHTAYHAPCVLLMPVWMLCLTCEGHCAEESAQLRLFVESKTKTTLRRRRWLYRKDAMLDTNYRNGVAY